MSEDSTNNGDDTDAFERIATVESIDTDQWDQIHQTHFDPDADRELATELALAIAEARDVDPLDSRAMPPLFESVDARALEETFFGSSGTTSRRPGAGAVTFVYEGYRVALRADGWIFVYETQ